MSLDDVYEIAPPPDGFHLSPEDQVAIREEIALISACSASLAPHYKRHLNLPGLVFVGCGLGILALIVLLLAAATVACEIIGGTVRVVRCVVRRG
jgi:predicted RNA methylase